MVAQARSQWSRHIEQMVRSNRYNRIGEGLAGVPLEEALVEITTDVMHLCRREGVSWEKVLAEARHLFEREQRRRAIDLAETPMGS